MKISLIVGLVLLAAFVVVNLAGGGGGHGPSRHSGSGRLPAAVADA